jgi:hypothetical protein
MNNVVFEKIIKSRLDEILATLASKGDEYTVGLDRLSNFKEAAELLGRTEEQVLLGYVTKHIIALKDFIQDGKPVSQAQWVEKFQDIICYMLILETLLIENERFNENINVQ